jgi:hypothetical protein
MISVTNNLNTTDCIIIETISAIKLIHTSNIITGHCFLNLLKTNNLSDLNNITYRYTLFLIFILLIIIV